MFLVPSFGCQSLCEVPRTAGAKLYLAWLATAIIIKQISYVDSFSCLRFIWVSFKCPFDFIVEDEYLIDFYVNTPVKSNSLRDNRQIIPFSCLCFRHFCSHLTTFAKPFPPTQEIEFFCSSEAQASQELCTWVRYSFHIAHVFPASPRTFSLWSSGIS